MGGKTIYIKMVAILQILAQIGCYVPALSAQFRITDRIFCRMGFGDSLEQNASSFITEIRELEYILKNVTPNSLVLIDEICRSTRPEDGQFLAWKFCEQMVCLRGIANRGAYFNVDHETTSEDGADKRSEPTKSSWSAMARLHDVTAPFVFVTTHFFNLTKLPEYFFNTIK